MSENSGRGVTKIQIIWAVGCAGFGIVFTILFSAFVDSYTKQATTQQEILNRLTGIEAQMIMADFPNLRSDLDKVKAEMNTLKEKHNLEIQNLNEKLTNIVKQVESLKGGRS